MHAHLQTVCTGKGYVMQLVTAAIQVFGPTGALVTPPVATNQFLGARWGAVSGLSLRPKPCLRTGVRSQGSACAPHPARAARSGHRRGGAEALTG